MPRSPLPTRRARLPKRSGREKFKFATWVSCCFNRSRRRGERPVLSLTTQLATGLADGQEQVDHSTLSAQFYTSRSKPGAEVARSVVKRDKWDLPSLCPASYLWLISRFNVDCTCPNFGAEKIITKEISRRFLWSGRHFEIKTIDWWLYEKIIKPNLESRRLSITFKNPIRVGLIVPNRWISSVAGG